MPNNVLERLVVEIVGDVGQLKASLEQAKQLTSQFSRQTTTTINMSGATKGMSEALAQAKALGNEAATLRQRFQATGGEFDATRTRLLEIKTEALGLSKAFNADSTEARRFAQAARYADATVAGMEGRMSRLGLASQVNLAATQALSMEMYRFGPAGMVMANGLQGISGNLAKIGPAATAAVAGVAGLGLAAYGLIRKGIPEVEKFQKALQLMISTGNDLTASSLTKALDDAAAAAGKAGTQFTRADLADSLAQLVKAGISASEALKLLPASMQLAIESDQNLTEASTRLLQNLRSFGLGAESAQRAADDLAKASLISAANAQQLSEGLANIGPVANEAGLSLESTLGALVTLSNSGLDPATKGSNAFRVVMTSLLKPSKQAEQALQALGVATKDTAGHQRDMQSILSELVSSAAKYNISIDQTTGQVTGEQDAIAELARIFRTRGITAIAALADAQRSGITTWADYTRMVKAGQGELKSYADTLLSNNLDAATKGLQTSTKNLAESLTLALAPALITAEDQWAKWLADITGMHQPTFNLIGDINDLTKSLAGVKNAADLTAVLDKVDGELTGNAKKAFDTWRSSIDLTTASLKDVIKYAQQAGVEGTKALAMQALQSQDFLKSGLMTETTRNNLGQPTGNLVNADLAKNLSDLINNGKFAQAAYALASALSKYTEHHRISTKDMTAIQDLLTVLEAGGGQKIGQRIADQRTQAAVQKAMQTLPGRGALENYARQDLQAVNTANATGTPSDILAANAQLKQDEAYYNNLLKTAKADYTFTELVDAVRQVMSRTKETTGQVVKDAKALTDMVAADGFYQPYGSAAKSAVTALMKATASPSVTTPYQNASGGFYQPASAPYVDPTPAIVASVRQAIIESGAFRQGGASVGGPAYLSSNSQSAQESALLGGRYDIPTVAGSNPVVAALATLQRQALLSVSGVLQGGAGQAGEQTAKIAAAVKAYNDIQIATFEDALKIYNASTRTGLLSVGASASVNVAGPTYGGTYMPYGGASAVYYNRLASAASAVTSPAGNVGGFYQPLNDKTQGAYNELVKGAADSASKQRQAASQFAQTVVQAGGSFAQALISGSPGGIISGGLGAVGSILSATGPQGALIGAVVSTIGSIFGGLIGMGGTRLTNENSAAAAAVRASSTPPALDLKFIFHQTNTLGGITDPNTQAALNKSADDAFKRFEQLLSKTVIPRLNRLDRATGLAS